MVVSFGRHGPVVDLKRAISKYKPYVFPACSFYGKNRLKQPHST
jgi:hypothetical protein